MPHSLFNTNLKLLESKLQDLRDTAYFDSRVLRYIAALQQVIAKLTDPTTNLADETRAFVAFEVWNATEFIAGSAPRLQPYEMIYGLRCAVREWFAAGNFGAKPLLIVTSLVQEPNFYFKSTNPNFNTILEANLRVSIEYEIVQIKLPDIYRRKPLYTVALYHELGHFIDTRFAISEYVGVFRPRLALPGLPPATSALTPRQKEQIRLFHLREYFADLFAACYCGGAMKRFLEGFAPHSGSSATHPATCDRIQVVQALLEGREHNLVAAFNAALAARQQPGLRTRFIRPDTDACFDAIRPATLDSDAEVHGILDAAWEYLDRAAEQKTGPWGNLDDLEIERVINDLVEKSIRNRMIVEQWSHEASQP